MDSLTELYNSQIVPLDEELEKQATEMWKQAEEEDAAGRIMARGFADELDKLAQAPEVKGFADKTVKLDKAPSIKAGPYKAGVGAGGSGPPAKVTTRSAVAPAASASGRQAASTAQFSQPNKGPAAPSLSANPLKGYKAKGPDKAMAFLDKKPKTVASNP